MTKDKDIHLKKSKFFCCAGLDPSEPAKSRPSFRAYLYYAIVYIF